MNKFEKKFLGPMRFTVFLCVVSNICNVVIPLVEKPKFTFLFIPHAIIIGLFTYASASIYMFFGADGRFVPLLSWFIVRSAEFVAYCLLLKDLSFKGFGVLMVLDLLCIAMLMYCKSNYEGGRLRKDINGNLHEVTTDEYDTYFGDDKEEEDFEDDDDF